MACNNYESVNLDVVHVSVLLGVPCLELRQTITQGESKNVACSDFLSIELIDLPVLEFHQHGAFTILNDTRLNEHFAVLAVKRSPRKDLLNSNTFCHNTF